MTDVATAREEPAMDLEALPPEEPTPTPPASGNHTDAPATAWAPAPWEAPGSAAPGPAAWAPVAVAEPAAAERLGLSRPTKVLAGTIAVAVIAAGAWAAGTAIHGAGSSVRFAPASSTAAASTGTSGGTPPTPHQRRNLGGGGMVSGVDTAGDTITVTLPGRRSATTTPGAAPVAPATTSATIKVTSSTVFYVTKPATATDITTGMRIGATGTANADATLTATNVTLLSSALAPNAPKPPAAAAPNGGAPPAPKGPANPPFAFGTVTSVTASGADTTLVVTGPRGARTVVVTPTTTITETIKGALDDVRVGDVVLARGHRNTDGSVDAAVVVDVAAGLKGAGRFGFGFGRGFGPGRFRPSGPAGPFGGPAPAGANASTSSPV